MNKDHESPLTILYVKVGDYYFPNFTLPPDAGDIGFWGRRRREFLREQRPVTFNQLVLSGELFSTLPCSIRMLLNDWKALSKP